MAVIGITAAFSEVLFDKFIQPARYSFRLKIKRENLPLTGACNRGAPPASLHHEGSHGRRHSFDESCAVRRRTPERRRYWRPTDRRRAPGYGTQSAWRA